MTAFSGSPWLLPINIGQYYGGDNIVQNGEQNYSPTEADFNTLLVMTNPQAVTVTMDAELGGAGDTFRLMSGQRTGLTLQGTVSGVLSVAAGQAVELVCNSDGEWVSTVC